MYIKAYSAVIRLIVVTSNQESPQSTLEQSSHIQ